MAALAKRERFGYTDAESGECMKKSFDFIVRTKQDLIDAVCGFGVALGLCREALF